MTSIMGKLPSLTLVWDSLPLWPVITRAHLLLQTRNGSSDDPPSSPPLELQDPAFQWRSHMQGAAIARFHASGASRLIVDFSLLQMSLVADGGLRPLAWSGKI